MTAPSDIANALLGGELPSREIAGMIFEISSPEHPVAMKTPPAIEYVERATQKGWTKAASAVLSNVPEYKGSAIINHRSKQVRRLYLQHGTDTDTLRGLTSMACVDMSDSLAWAERVDMELLSAKITSEDSIPHSVLEIYGRRLVESAKSGAVRIPRKISSGKRERVLVGALVATIRANDSSSAERVLSTVAAQTHKKLLTSSWKRLEGETNDTLLSLMRKYFKNADELEDDFFTYGSIVRPTTQKILGEFLDIMKPNGGSYLAIESILDNLDLVLEKSPISAVRRLLEEVSGWCDSLQWETKPKKPCPVSHEALDSALRRLAGVEPDCELRVGRTVEAAYPHKFSNEAMLQMLRHGSAEDTWEWMSLEGPNSMHAEIFTSLVADPGVAFVSSWHDTATKGPVNFSEFIALVDFEIGTILQHPDVDILVETMGAACTERIINLHGQHAGRASDYLTRRFTEILGPDKEAWRTALSVVAAANQPLGRALRAAAKLQKR
jgi:hypothetical protein